MNFARSRNSLTLTLVMMFLAAGMPLAAQSIEADGEVKALGFDGDGSKLSNVNASQLGGVDATGYALTGDLQNAVSALSPRSIHIAPGMIDFTASPGYGGPPERVVLGGWNHPALEFGTDELESITFLLPVPVDWDQSSAFKITLLWSSPTITGQAAWDLSWKATGPDSSVIGAIGGPTVMASPSATSNGLVVTELYSSTPAANDILTTDKLLYMRLIRLIGLGDALADVAHVYGLEIVYNEP